MEAIGAGAVNQAIKATAISRGYVAPGGFYLVSIPSYINMSIDGEERTGTRLLVESALTVVGWPRCRRSYAAKEQGKGCPRGTVTSVKAQLAARTFR